MAADLSRLIEMFESSAQGSIAEREEAERAVDYYDDRQLTTEELATLKKRKQPPVIENLVKPKIDGLCGLERQTRTDPMCYPRTFNDEGAAQCATDSLRYVADDQKLDVKRSAVFKNMLGEGYGGVEVGAARTRGGIDPAVEQIAWSRLFYDKHSSALDFSDASYKGFITWMDADKARKRWPGKEQLISDTLFKGTSDVGSTYSDKPKWAFWSDKGRNRVRIITIYYLEGDEWYRCVYTLSGELEPCAPSPYLDEDGKPECALILQSAYVDRDNDRYGIVRGMFSLQDEVNKRRSKYLHLINSRQVRMSRGYEGSKEAIRREIARPDGIVVADKDEMEVIPTIDLTQGHATLLQEAKQALQGVGPNAHMQGKEGNDQSGRAIMAMQQAGMTEMAPLLDGLRDFNLRVFRAIWNRIRQFWTEERWIRVTDDENAVRFFAVNTSKGQLAMQKLGEAFKAQKIDQPTAMQYAQQIQADPSMHQPANVLSELDVDIQIDEVMNTPTLQIEQFEQLVKLASTGMFAVPPELIIRASSLRDKQKLLDLLEEQKQSQAQQGQAQAEAAQRGMIAEVAGKEAKAALDGAKAEGEQIKNVMLIPQAQLQAHQQGLQQG